MALSEATKEAIYFKNLLNELIGENHCITLYNDNISAQKLANNPLFHRRSKHIDIRHHFIREAIADENIELKYLSSDEMTADIFTKSLNAQKYDKFRSKLGLYKLCKF